MLKLYCPKKRFEFPIPLPFRWKETPFIGDWDSNVHLKDVETGTKFGPVDRANYFCLLPYYGISIELKKFMEIVKEPKSEFADLLPFCPEVLFIDEEKSRIEKIAKSQNLPWSWVESKKENKTLYFVVNPYDKNLYLMGLQVTEPNNPFF